MIVIWIQLLSLVSTSTALWDNADKDHEIFNSSICMFADKTSMIDTFFHYTDTESKYQVFTAPLGFGKTTNLKMLKRFVQIEIDEFGHKLDKTRTSSYKLFTNEKLAISNHPNTIEAHLAEYPVLYFDYSEVMEFSFPKTYRKICSKVHELFKSYQWVYEILRERYSNNSNMQDAQAEQFNGKLSLVQKMINTSQFENDYIQKDCLCAMVEILYEYFQHQVFVFIEYYDRYWFDGENENCRLWDMYTKTKFSMYQGVLYDLAYQLFQPKMSKYIKYVFATGTHPIYLQNDNFTYNSFLGDHPFTKYYGFTTEEVTRILNPRAKAPITELRNLRISHNGYSTKVGDLALFQPSSIINYFPQSRSSSSIEHSPEGWTLKASYELKPYLLIDPPPLNGQWKVLKIESIREKVQNLVSEGNVTFQLRFESSHKVKENLLEGLKNEPQTQKVTSELFFSMLFENGYLTYTEVPGCYRVPNQNRLNVLEHYLRIFVERQQNDEPDEVLRSWREYMKQNRLVR
ncbi:uncharacterized protein LOC135844034 [Planococcus citri]|uniref:uncharacterized protein LOC135844034 n=1 Tax=Planococcus citri TaxID=170843 RepID=UPI0031F859B8